MSITVPIIVRVQAHKTSKDCIVGALPAEIAADNVGIVVSDTISPEQLGSCVAALKSCFKTTLNLIKERRGQIYFNVNEQYQAHGDQQISDDLIVPAGRVAVIVGNLFGFTAGSTSVPDTAQPSLLTMQTHPISVAFDNCLDVLIESALTTPPPLPQAVPAAEIVQALGVPNSPAIVRLTGSPWNIGTTMDIQATIDPDGPFGLNHVNTRGYTLTEYSKEFANFLRGWPNCTVEVVASSNPNIRDISFTPILDGVSITIDSVAVT